MKQTRMKQTRMKQTRIMETGYIKIKPDGVWFVYHELPEPNPMEEDLWVATCDEDIMKMDQMFEERLEKYEASKRSIEMENEYVPSEIYPTNLR